MSDDRIKVILIEPNIEYPGNTGGSVHLMELSNALSDKVDLKILCDCKEDFEEDGIEFYHIRSGRFSFFSILKIWRLSKDVDIIHTRADPFELAGLIVARLRDIPILGEVNINFLSYEKKNSIRDLFYPFFHSVKYLWTKFVVSRLDKIICVSKSIKKELSTLNIDEKKVNVVHNGGNPGRFSGLSKEEMRRELDLDMEDYLVLLMGELGPRHGLERLVNSNLENVKFLVVGGKERYKDYIDSMKSKASDSFIFVDPVPYDEIKNYIVASDITVAPYEESDNKHEFGYCPLKILDSMAAKRPAVASDRPWIREILSNKEGEVTNNIDEGILNLKDKNTRKRKGKNAVKRIKESLSWEKTAEKIYNVYTELLSQDS